MIVQLTRIIFLAAGAMGGFAVSQLIDWTETIGFSRELVILIFIILGAAIGYLIGGIFGRETTTAYQLLEQKLRDHQTTDLALGGAGLVFGLLVALLVSIPLRLVEPRWMSFLTTALLYGLCAYGGIKLFLIKSDDLGARFASRLGPAQLRLESMTYLDTSAVIDGRFAALHRAGFLPGELRVPRFVLAELQTLSDSADDTKRARGRRGLDNLTKLAGGEEAVAVFEADYPEVPMVDAKLVRLALETKGALVTVDFNLTKVARVEGATALNVNELAEAIRPAFLPGDCLHIAIAKEGKEPGQGVGYLEDGTMVVVQDGKGAVGSDIDVEVASVLQTSAGRMIFARPS
ncbi:MAG: PIN/TRAM domain-containing protein [Coriobacteriia bacterium]|nr:PIN/TRAM domain-containing protein [Coriobacteriia bacterium]